MSTILLSLLCIILILQSFGQFNFFSGCLLRFLLKTVEKQNNITFIKNKKDPENVSTVFSAKIGKVSLSYNYNRKKFHEYTSTKSRKPRKEPIITTKDATLKASNVSFSQKSIDFATFDRNIVASSSLEHSDAGSLRGTPLNE